ncbi:hypothetical protein [Lysobacter olei]
MSTPLTPKYREALCLAINAPGGELVRVRGGFGRKGQPEAGVVTSRMANTLECDGLVAFDQPMFPTAISLTAKGVAAAEQLVDAEAAKAGAA